jgi:nucleotide-binding universal stress UspA family protein
MKYILAPVDFSPVSRTAAFYGAHMAASMNIDLHLLHVVQLPVVYGDVPVPTGSYDVVIEEGKAEIAKIALELNTALQSQVNIHTEVKLGSPVHELLEMARHGKPYAIVMGTQGAGAVERFFLGSTTLATVEEAPCPVIVVPPGYQFAGVHKMGLACDFKNVVERIPEKTINHLLDDFGAKLEIVHANPDYVEFEPATIEEEVLVDTMFERHKAKFHFLHSGYTEESIMEFVAKEKIDILIVIPKHRGFFQSMFAHHHTREFVLKATVPVMVLHS